MFLQKEKNQVYSTMYVYIFLLQMELYHTFCKNSNVNIYI